jgi:hypothetical protein
MRFFGMNLLGLTYFRPEMPLFKCKEHHKQDKRIDLFLYLILLFSE